MDKFKYGDIGVEIKYVGPGQAPYTKVPTNVYDVTIKGPGAEITLPDWIPIRRKLFQRGVPGMAHAAVLTLEDALLRPQEFKSRKLAEGFPTEMIEEVMRVARTLEPVLPQAVNFVFDEIHRFEAREESRKRHAQAKGPREWFPEGY